MDKGFIKLSRKFFDNDIWKAARTYNDSEAWLDLIQSARFEASEITSRVGGRDITWGIGQYPASNRFLAARWRWSEQKVKTFLAKLKKKGMINTDCSQGMNVITLINYEEYNSPAIIPQNNPINGLNISDLQEIITQQVAQQVAKLQKEQPTPNPNIKKEKNIKETTTNVVAKKDAAKAATLSRKDSFYQSLVPFVGKFPKDMIRTFFDYWSELNKSGTKMRYELEKTWELPKRLATWANRERMPVKPPADIGVVLKDNSPDKYDNDSKKWDR